MRAVGLVLAGIVTVSVLLWVFQRRLVYFPTRALPEVAGVEEVAYTTEDGLEAVGWFVPPVGPEARGTVVVFNGNAGNRAHRLPLAEGLAARGFGVFLVDYRGFGGNGGSPSEEGLAADARAAVGALVARPDVDPGRVVYFGESLGAAVALGLALEREPAVLVLRSPFTSLPEVARVHYPFLVVPGLVRDRYPNLERIRRVDIPVLVVAGSGDRIVPVEQSRAVYEAASGPRRMVVIEGADHNDPALAWGPAVLDAVASFVDEFVSGR